MIQLQPHKDIYAIGVPAEAKDPYINGYGDHICYSINSLRQIDTIPLPPGNWQILGEVTSNSATFDIGPLIGGNTMSAKHNIESFYSLLAADGVYFENPASHPVDIEPQQRSHYDKIVERWQSFEGKLVEKVLIIQKT